MLPPDPDMVVQEIRRAQMQQQLPECVSVDVQMQMQLQPAHALAVTTQLLHQHQRQGTSGGGGVGGAHGVMVPDAGLSAVYHPSHGAVATRQVSFCYMAKCHAHLVLCWLGACQAAMFDTTAAHVCALRHDCFCSNVLLTSLVEFGAVAV